MSGPSLENRRELTLVSTLSRLKGRIWNNGRDKCKAKARVLDGGGDGGGTCKTSLVFKSPQYPHCVGDQIFPVIDKSARHVSVIQDPWSIH